MKTALNNIRRSPFQAIAAIFVVTLTMFIVGVFGLVTLATRSLLLSFETKPQVIAYLKDGHTMTQVGSLINSLVSSPGIKNAVYISKDDALNLYKTSVSNDPVLLGSVTDWGIVTAEILPASVEITASDPSAFPAAVSILEQSEIVNINQQNKKDIDFPQDIISELTRWTNGIRTSGIILVVTLSFVCILTMVIIVSMKISSRRTEIGTMKLLGASNSYIIKPYLQETIVYGLVGGFFGWIFTFISILYSTPFIAPRLSGIIEFPISYTIIFALLLALVLLGTTMSFFSGLFATTRFVKRSK
jgi:cell division transport system permease protein